MKLFCEGLDLMEAVLKVVKATSNKTTNPILEGIKLTALNNSLTLVATDGELAIQQTINADVKVEGEIVMPGRLFSDFVKKISYNKEVYKKTRAHARKRRASYMIEYLVIGAGVVGGMVARELSRYTPSVHIVERASDVAMGATRTNSAIVHAGYDPKPGTQMARLNVRGNRLMKQYAKAPAPIT